MAIKLYFVALVQSFSAVQS